MPTISEFYGIMIRMYYDEELPPHFHAIYGDFEMRISLDSLNVIDGHLPVRQERLVLEWAKIRQKEIQEEWQRIEKRQPLFRIEPLK
ncbi:MAG: hypothetical protein COX46_05060 [bacterium (Candidatus Ratteibacteria) CG23_combo_of_CG06-09_8_20_14_all_48_7]|uniref:Transcriptional regulator n=1 Tax=bacterium (Candidatus Ratteibacteria) CG23_combo_of_CG06-09_8_20_14_all_48_7 TaxID=2014292 RepID=A0A2G9Y931_9BACT|nr:MAG: hypothetical protein COX46_05060 [bacterium (Candidatus Ratteibacteria) CG23_combo_of_CG06-09_8_20_14_all_48_7]